MATLADLHRLAGLDATIRKQALQMNLAFPSTLVKSLQQALNIPLPNVAIQGLQSPLLAQAAFLGQQADGVGKAIPTSLAGVLQQVSRNMDAATLPLGSLLAGMVPAFPASLMRALEQAAKVSEVPTMSLRAVLDEAAARRASTFRGSVEQDDLLCAFANQRRPLDPVPSHGVTKTREILDASHQVVPATSGKHVASRGMAVYAILSLLRDLRDLGHIQNPEEEVALLVLAMFIEFIYQRRPAAAA